MSFATWNFLKLYAKWREAFLRQYPQKRLIHHLGDDANGTDEPVLTLGTKGKKIGAVMVALVILLLASDRK